ncbi:MAG: hypothetical protein EU544_04270 [Promethearchaeota archaeon]|nr:MAG: hypothetical protein EU544_04270 [Candidatus Lokiarchaeota archaeon]
MTDLGINGKRMIVCVILGAISGAICATGTTILQPVSYSITMAFLFYIVYNRIVLGVFIGLVGEVTFVDNEILNPILRGALFGAIISVIMIIIPEISSMNYLIAGIVFGAIIDLIGSKLAPQ